MSDGHKPWYKSKKLYTAAIAAAVPILNNRFGLGLETEELLAVMMPLIAYVLGEAWTDAAHCSRNKEV